MPSNAASRSAWTLFFPKASPPGLCGPERFSGPTIFEQVAGANLEDRRPIPGAAVAGRPSPGRRRKSAGHVRRARSSGRHRHLAARIFAAPALWPLRFRWCSKSRTTCTSPNSNRRRSEALTELAREIDGLLRLPDFARKFLERAVELAGARAGRVALFQEGRFQTMSLHAHPGSAPSRSSDRACACPELGARSRCETISTTILIDVDSSPIRSSTTRPCSSDLPGSLRVGARADRGHRLRLRGRFARSRTGLELRLE